MGRIAVIGLGYIGLPTAVVLARAGWDVVGVDIDAQRVAQVQAGRLPFIEPGLDQWLAEVVANGQLVVQSQVPSAEVYIVAVPTPLTRGGTQPDLSYVNAAAEAIAAQLTGAELIILESTSPPGTTKQLADVVARIRPELFSDDVHDDQRVDFAHCPERVLPGNAISELVGNDRIIGGLRPRAAERAREIYSTFCQGEIALTDATTAEFVKLAENAYRDVNIAFANELSILSAGLGVDVWELISLANRHPRVNILQPGPGVGGHCIAVDPWFIAATDVAHSPLIQAARAVNDGKPRYVCDQVVEAVTATKARDIAVLGLAFKADIDDLRGSPALEIAIELANRLPGELLVVEPHIVELPEPLSARPEVSLVSLAAALERADVVLVLVDHTAFKEVTAAQLQGKVVIDTRGIYRTRYSSV